MIKCKVVEKFDLKDFDQLKNIKRKSVDKRGSLYVGDEFECDEQMAKYLTGENVLKKTVVEIVEVDPEPVVEKLEVPEIKLETVDEEANFKKKKNKKGNEKTHLSVD